MWSGCGGYGESAVVSAECSVAAVLYLYEVYVAWSYGGK